MSGVGFRPIGLMLASNNLVTGTGISSDARLTFGAGDTTTEGTTWWADEDNQNTMDTNEITKTDKAFVHASEADASILSEADPKSVDSDGFTLTWTTNNSTAVEILYVAFGNTRQVLPPLTSLHSLQRPMEKTLLSNGKPATR